tara:strand:- start:36 stop:662 length:627 start_codon:yes stop_codon:yes gene_type:complete
MSYKKILENFPLLDSGQIQKIKSLKLIYDHYNKNINLISRKDFNFFYERHVLHSLSIAKIISFKDDSDIMDLGTGGGFPGIPLAIYFPQVNFILIDSIKKKTDCIKKIAKELNLVNIKVINSRAEDVQLKFDFVMSRAVAPMFKLYKWSNNKIKIIDKNQLKNGLICLKGGDMEKEFKLFKKKCKIYNISNYFKDEFFETKKILHCPI